MLYQLDTAATGVIVASVKLKLSPTDPDLEGAKGTRAEGFECVSAKRNYLNRKKDGKQ